MNHRDLDPSWSYGDTNVWFVGWLRLRFCQIHLTTIYKSFWRYLEWLLHNQFWCKKKVIWKEFGGMSEFAKVVMGRCWFCTSFVVPKWLKVWVNCRYLWVFQLQNLSFHQFPFVLRYMVRQSVICANEDKSGRPRLREKQLYIFPEGAKSWCIWKVICVCSIS
jgi:hypothetical protein